jgi:hypothetical protein
MDEVTRKILDQTRPLSPTVEVPVTFNPATLLDDVAREILTEKGYQLVLEYDARSKMEKNSTTKQK